MHRATAALRSRGGTLAGLGFFMALAVVPCARAEVKPLEVGAFQFEHEVIVPGTPEQVFDLFTGDIRPWWDHHFSEKPKRLFIEAKVGGTFHEIFDDEGNGAIHATVTYVVAGRSLRFVGPLGFSGNALDMVHSLEFEPVEGGRTRISLVVRGAGQIQEGWAEAVDGVWHHFLVEQFKPYAVKKLGNP